MSKIFRLHKGSSDGVIDWHGSSQHIGETYINTIEDPAGDNAKKQITSIPSPFARMDLVRTAFRYIVNKKQLDGNTIYHRIVSEALDVSEIFFNADSLKDIEIIPWSAGVLKISGNEIVIDNNSDLGTLLKSNNPKIKLFGETIKMFLMQDRSAYNFAALKSIYLLNYKRGPELINIIGGTSPASLFFSSANDDIREYINIQFGDHKVFDTNYYPLLKRSDDFIKYWYALKVFIPNFSSVFKDIDDYLNLTLISPQFSDSLKNEIRNFDDSTYGREYGDIKLGNNEGFGVEILGNKLRGYTQKPLVSGFEISAVKAIEGNLPLVLPNEPFNEPINYVNGKWKTEYRAPYFDSRPLKVRTLPFQEHIVYPYLTISDFLEPYIIRIPYPINKEKYFNGNFTESNFGYALPLKKELFKYFSVREVIGSLPDGKKFFELIKQAGDAIEAVLRIPIKNNKYIKFSRLYIPNQFQDSIQQPDEAENKGIIIENQFSITVFPFLQSEDDSSSDYRIALIDRDTKDIRTKENQYQLSFYDGNEILKEQKETAKKIRSDKNEGNLATSIYYIVQKRFNLIEVRPNSTYRGLIIPLFKPPKAGSQKFSFAVDFGTTNTHVEYKVGNGKSMPFEITESDIQIGSLHYNNAETRALLPVLGSGSQVLLDLIPQEFLPEKIGKSFDNKMPFRTIISESDNIDFKKPTYALADFNIPFVYEKTDLPPNFRLTSNLKWANFKSSDDNKIRVEAFIEKLLILIRNKVLLNGGDLADTKIIWFYPSSMSENRRGLLAGAWEKFSHKYISNDTQPYKLSESVAPYYYFSKKGGIIATDKPVACIDIGGGTTDIVIYENNAPIALTSFKYAANSIFGDGYGNSMSSNGFVKKYYSLIKDKLRNDDDNLDVLYKAMEQIRSNDSSPEMIAFFFSLESNNAIRSANYSISFSEMLKSEEDSKIIFVFFYSSIIYHLAQLMKSKGLEPPRYITFSGTGSKVINIVDSDPKQDVGSFKNDAEIVKSTTLTKLNDYTKIIFSDVYSRDIDNIEIRQYNEPKEITCKGGLLCDNFTDIDKIKIVLVGDKNQRSFFTDPQVETKGIKYNEIYDAALLSSVQEEVTNFIDKFFSWNNKYNYYSKFGAKQEDFKALLETMKGDIKMFLKAGIEDKLGEVEQKNIKIEESLFFYSIVGLLNKVALQLLKQ